MPTRGELHTLVDSLPEGAMEAAHRLLTTLQVFRPHGRPPFELFARLPGRDRFNGRHSFDGIRQFRRGIWDLHRDLTNFSQIEFTASQMREIVDMKTLIPSGNPDVGKTCVL